MKSRARFSWAVSVVIFLASLFQSSAEEVVISVFPSTGDLHVYDDNDFFEETPELKSLPVYPHQLETLGAGRIFDMRPIAERRGLALDPDEVFLYSPDSHLVFFRGRRDRSEFARLLYEIRDRSPMIYRFWLSSNTVERGESDQQAAEREELLLMSGESNNGGRFVLREKGGIQLELEILFGPGERRNEGSVSIKGHLPLGGALVEVDTDVVVVEGQEKVVVQRVSSGEENVMEQIVLLVDAVPTPRQQQHREDWQKQKAAEIDAELTKRFAKQSEPNSKSETETPPKQ